MSEKVVELVEGKMRPLTERDGFAEDMAQAAARCAQEYPNDLVAFVLVAVKRDGGFATYHEARDGQPIGVFALAGIAQAAIQHNLIACNAAVSEMVARNVLVEVKPPEGAP